MTREQERLLEMDTSLNDERTRFIKRTSWKKKKQQQNMKLCYKLAPFLMLYMLTAAFLTYALYQLHQNSEQLKAVLLKEYRAQPDAPEIVNITNEKMREIKPSFPDSPQSLILNIDTASDSKTDCKASQPRQSFPDIDYSLLGYNILRGFPLAIGHDPGFTYPLFKAEYSDGGMTADCLYNVPNGFVVVPDVSCVTSFSSYTVRNQFQISGSLAASVSVNGGGWGVSFSASTGFKESFAEMASGEYVYIYSTAYCNYYFSKLKTPKFDDDFMKFVIMLNATEKDEHYFELFDIYGTHFTTEVTYGARYTYKYQMQTSQYEAAKEEGINVEAHASYTGLFSVGGGTSMDESHKSEALSFAKDVTTETITVGAPPPSDGQTNTWASEVKKSPVPSRYTLVSIEELFTEKYMRNLNIDYNKISGKINTLKSEYCNSLKQQGLVESCEGLLPGLGLHNTKLKFDNNFIFFKPYYIQEIQTSSSFDCFEYCSNQIDCKAATYCVKCRDKNLMRQRCVMYKDIGYQVGSLKDEEFESTIFIGKIKSELKFKDTAIVGFTIGLDSNTDKEANETRCRFLCETDDRCIAFSHCDCPDQETRCKLYSKYLVKGLENQPGTFTVFPPHIQHQTSTNKPTTKTVTNSITRVTQSDHTKTNSVERKQQ